MDDRLIFKIVVLARLPLEKRDATGESGTAEHAIHVRTNKGIEVAMKEAVDWLGDGWVEKTIKSAEAVGDVLIDVK